MDCPCFSTLEYPFCCESYHKGARPPSPEKLMRSRYSAYVLGLAGYIIETTHSKSRPPNLDLWKEEIEAFCQKTSFVGLFIHNATDQTVTFTAKLKRGDEDVSFCEKSLFAKENGRLVYVEGEITPLAQ